MYEFILHYQKRSLQKEGNYTEFTYKYITTMKGLLESRLFAEALLEAASTTGDNIPYSVEYRNIKSNTSRFVFLNGNRRF